MYDIFRKRPMKGSKKYGKGFFEPLPLIYSQTSSDTTQFFLYHFHHVKVHKASMIILFLLCKLHKTIFLIKRNG